MSAWGISQDDRSAIFFIDFIKHSLSELIK